MRALPRLMGVALSVALVAGAAAQPVPAVSRRDADRLTQKIDEIAQRGQTRLRTPVRTPVSESEINSYLAVYARDQLPAGVVQPRVSILGPDRVAARATMDLDAVRRNSSGSWLDPASYLTGHVPVSAEGVLRTRDGVAHFDLQRAEVAGITVPKGLLQDIITYYSRGPEYPRGINIDDPFPLPAGIRRIEMRRGEAVVVQQ